MARDEEQQVGRWWGERVVHTFRFPSRLAAEAGCTSVGMVKLTWRDEVTASKLAQETILEYTAALARLSICEVDGRPVEQDGVEVRRLWESDPGVRSCLLQARVRVSNPDDADVQGFLQSMEQRAG